MRIASLLAVVTALAVVLGYPLLASWSSTAASPTGVPPREHSGPQRPPRQAAGETASPTGVPPREAPTPQRSLRQAVDEAASPANAPRSEHPRPQQPPRQALGEAASPGAIPRTEHHRALGGADGAVPHGTTVFDDEHPGVANLDPAFLGALRQAATAAADDGVAFYVTSGWRSPEYQNQLLREAVSTYGSEEEAAQWVATATTSPHVSGDAIDIGSLDARVWLAEHGAEYGLCQVYHNEPWHYELRPQAIDHGCPPMYADPRHDPRMQQ